jgi:hypothetical protein
MPSSAPPKTNANIIQLVAIGPTVQIPIFSGSRRVMGHAADPTFNRLVHLIRNLLFLQARVVGGDGQAPLYRSIRRGSSLAMHRV